MFHIVAAPSAGHQAKKTKLTCVTCKLKKCIGKCRFEQVACSRPLQAA